MKILPLPTAVFNEKEAEYCGESKPFPITAYVDMEMVESAQPSVVSGVDNVTESILHENRTLVTMRSGDVLTVMLPLQEFVGLWKRELSEAR